MNHLDLFSGIGGFSLAGKWVWGKEHNVVLFVEIDPFCRKVLKFHWPDVPIISDIRDVTYERVLADTNGRLCKINEEKEVQTRGNSVDPYCNSTTNSRTKIHLLTGGFPCQPFSVAGKRGSKEDDRYLWPEMLRVIREIRPTWIIGENVAGIINLALNQVLSDLESASYEVQPFLIPACAVDAPHRRDRVWIVAHNSRIQSKREKQWSQRKRIGVGSESINVADNESGGWSNTSTKEKRNGYCGNKTGREIKATQDRGCGVVGGSGKHPEWLPEPNVDRVVARISPWMDGYINETSKGTEKILQAMWRRNEAQTLQWSFRGSINLQTQKILLSELCEYEGAPKTLGNLSLESKETQEKILRSVWINGISTCPSCRRRAKEQRSREYPDALRILPQLLTCDCGSVRLDATGTPSETSKVDRLKSLGNAIVPQVVVPIMQAIKARDEENNKHVS